MDNNIFGAFDPNEKPQQVRQNTLLIFHHAFSITTQIRQGEYSFCSGAQAQVCTGPQQQHVVSAFAYSRANI
jgi:hypothetical protein